MSRSSRSSENVDNTSLRRSKYQLRLYCTTSTFYTTAQNAFRTNSQPCPIEFPATCEVRVNNLVLQANLKGIKKKPGTAPPADLSKIARLDAGVSNRIDMVYVNGQANSGPKVRRIFLLVERTTDCFEEILSGCLPGGILLCGAIGRPPQEGKIPYARRSKNSK